MNNFEEKVVMLARFKNSEVFSDDVAYFAPELDTWKNAGRDKW
jgi:hypothetical protein